MNPLFHHRLWSLALLIRQVSLMWRSWWFEMSCSPPPSLSPYLVEEGQSRGCGRHWPVALGIAVETERFGLECTYIISLVFIITLICHYRLLQHRYSLDFEYTCHTIPSSLCLAFTKTYYKNARWVSTPCSLWSGPPYMGTDSIPKIKLLIQLNMKYWFNLNETTNPTQVCDVLI